MNNYKWISEKSYIDLFNECAKYINLDLNELNTNYSYTFVMTHPEMHPNTKNPELVYLSGFDRVAQEQLINYNFECAGIKYQEPINNSEINELIDSAAHALENHELLYGYIIRSADKDYLIESTLYKYIKKCYYNVKKDINNLLPSKRLCYLTLACYLNPDKYRYFREVFSNLYNKYFIEFDNLFIGIEKELECNLYTNDIAGALAIKLKDIIMDSSSAVQSSEAPLIDRIKDIKNIDILFSEIHSFSFEERKA
jgi:hypothetical protein